VRTLIPLLEKLAPPASASPFDNIGLLAGSGNISVKGIVVALDATSDVVNTAINTGANLIIVHHPLIFTPLKAVNIESATGNILARLLKNNISLYAMHTNLDSAPNGLNQYVAELLGLKKIRAVAGDGIIFRIGEVSKTVDSHQFAETVKKNLSLAGVRHYGPAKKVKNVAVCTGSGGDLVTGSLEAGADILVTGDVKHHNGVECNELGFPVIDAGHLGTEKHMVPLVGNYLKKNLTKLKKNIRITLFNEKELYDYL